jgi:hypothetical protein
LIKKIINDFIQISEEVEAKVSVDEKKRFIDCIEEEMGVPNEDEQQKNGDVLNEEDSGSDHIDGDIKEQIVAVQIDCSEEIHSVIHA